MAATYESSLYFGLQKYEKNETKYGSLIVPFRVSDVDEKSGADFKPYPTVSCQVNPLYSFEPAGSQGECFQFTIIANKDYTDAIEKYIEITDPISGTDESVKHLTFAFAGILYSTRVNIKSYSSPNGSKTNVDGPTLITSDAAGTHHYIIIRVDTAIYGSRLKTDGSGGYYPPIEFDLENGNNNINDKTKEKTNIPTKIGNIYALEFFNNYDIALLLYIRSFKGRIIIKCDECITPPSDKLIVKTKKSDFELSVGLLGISIMSALTVGCVLTVLYILYIEKNKRSKNRL